MSAPRRVALVGATASGKSAAAHAAALASGGTEIVSLDAMSAYKGMDLGTAKPTVEARREVPYHLIDVVEASEEMTVQAYQARCAEALVEIDERHATALLVGGSGLYVRAVVDELEIPPHDPAIRRALEDEARAPGGLEALRAELVATDPIAAARIDPRNDRRVVRALEVVRTTGRPFSSFAAELTSYPDRGVAMLGIAFDPVRTDAAIAARFAAWMEAGLLEEVRGLLAAPGGLSRTARQAAGYRQLIAHLEDDVALDVAVADAVTATRRLARRQWRWFRRDPRIRWVSDHDEARRALDELL
jgi:tRNA dimethylallyltransferase